MARPTYTLADYERVRRLRDAMAQLANESNCDVSDVSSALATMLIDIFIELLKVGDPTVATEMKRLAAMLTALAGAAGKPDEIHNVVVALGDVPHGMRAN